MVSSATQPAAEESPLGDAPPVAQPVHRKLEALVDVCWATQAAGLVAISLWIFSDGRFPGIARELEESAVGMLHGERSDGLSCLSPRLLMLHMLLAACTFSLGGVLVGLFIGGARQRTTRSWLLVTGFAAGWLTLWVAWPQLAWRGQQARLQRKTASLQQVVQSLRHDWPNSDGDRPEIGAFMAYPRHRPRMLMILSAAKAAAGAPPFTAVERSSVGAMRFELGGAESGAWLEWHPEGSHPASFIGGLDARYQLLRVARLAEHWYCTAYEAAPISRAGSEAE